MTAALKPAPGRALEPALPGGTQPSGAIALVAARLSLALEASAAGAARAQQAVDQVLAETGAAVGTRARALLLIEEAIMNVAMHGHDPGTGPHPVNLALHLLPQSIELHISDNGRAFDPCHGPLPARPTRLADAQPGGLGVHLMRRFARQMHYERRDGINLLRLVLDRAAD